MDAVRLGDEQRQAAVCEQVGVPPHQRFDLGPVVIGVEVEGGQDSVDAAGRARHVALTRARDERDGDARSEREVPERREVAVTVGGVEEVELVLELHRDDCAARVGLALRDDRQRAIEPALDMCQELRLRVTDPQSLLEGEPCRQGTAVPLGADVRTGSCDDGEPGLVGEVEECSDVTPAR